MKVYLTLLTDDYDETCSVLHVIKNKEDVLDTFKNDIIDTSPLGSDDTDVSLVYLDLPASLVHRLEKGEVDEEEGYELFSLADEESYVDEENTLSSGISYDYIECAAQSYLEWNGLPTDGSGNYFEDTLDKMYEDDNLLSEWLGKYLKATVTL